MANVNDLNDNAEDIDAIMYQNRTMLAPAFDPDETYNAGNRVVQLGEYYICNTDNTTGPWDSTYWDKTTIGEDIEANAGGGSYHTYSMTEKVVGKWIDGSDIYERVYPLQSAINITSGGTVITSYIDNISDIAKIMPQCVAYGDTDTSDLYINLNAGVMTAYVSVGMSTCKGIILRYIKSV